MYTYATSADLRTVEAECPYAERDVPRTIHSFLARAAERFPDRPAVSFQLESGPGKSAETQTWAELQRDVNRTANLLRSLGIGEGDVVAYVLPNCTEVIHVFLGGMVAGIVAPVNPLLEPDQMASILRETGAKVVVTLRAFPKSEVAQKVAEALEGAPEVRTVLEIDLKRYLKPPTSWIAGFLRPKYEIRHKARILDFGAERDRQPDQLNFEDAAGDRYAAYFHTGGTTGMPKVAQHKYSGLIYNGWLGSTLLFTEEHVMLCPLPMFHILAANIAFMSAVAAGSHFVMPTPAGYRGDGVFDNFWKLIERWRVNFIVGVPTAYAALMQRKVDADISSVNMALSGSAPMPLELFNRFEKATGVAVIEGYGMTETTGLISFNPVSGEKRVGSVGIPLTYTEVKIVRAMPQGPEECGIDEIGEICVANPGVYPGETYTDPAKNSDLYHFDRFLRTGDLGRLDAEGYLWITGRAKDLIIRGGHNIDPGMIEDVLIRHPAVAVAGAIGQPDSHAGEVPCVYVELVEGASVTSDELLAFAAEHIHERAALPKYIEVLSELPKTAVGKVFKPDLRRLAITRIFEKALDGTGARVRGVVEDKRRGLVARIDAGGAEEAALREILGAFPVAWEIA